MGDEGCYLQPLEVSCRMMNMTRKISKAISQQLREAVDASGMSRYA